jgi:putative two-component system response regulator
MKRVLIVDDDMINRKLLTVLLKKIGDIESVEAANGLEALNIIKSEPIDLVVLDVMMPVMDGPDFLKIFKSDDAYKDIPVAVLTTDDTRKNEVLELGASTVLIKPIKEPDLRNILAQYL